MFKSITTISRSVSLSIIAALVLQLSACGTLLYPERKGQTSGRLDIGVVALNALGLLVYFVPGVIAFAVDFSNGTIYLPGGSASINDNTLNVVNIDGEITNEKLEQVILDNTGETVSLNESHVLSRKQIATFGAIEAQVAFL